MAADLFVDTSAWYPLVLATDPHHATVADALRERVSARARIVTTNLVIAETHVLLLRRGGRQAAMRFVADVGTPPTLVVHSTAELEARAVTDWLSRYEDQGFSLTDAVSFAVMRELGIGEVLALDAHFAVAGFRLLPAQPAPGSSRSGR